MSRGNFHVVGNCLNVILPQDSSYYQNLNNVIPGLGLKTLNSDLYDIIKPQVDWEIFDKWKFESNTFVYQGENIIDMIYVVHRVWRDNIFPSDMMGSIANLYQSLQGDLHNLGNGFYIKSWIGVQGSGCTFTTGQGNKVPQAPFSKNRFLTTQAHELGHYLIESGHQNYGLMMGQLAPNLLITGPDARFSPWETRFLGYGSTIDVNFQESSDYHLNDFSSRDNLSNLQVLRVLNNPTDPDEFFIIAFRNKVSKYDRIMIGDTARGDAFRDIEPKDYGRGTYIYHVKCGYNWTTVMDKIDQECADGLYNWEFIGNFVPNWSYDQLLPIYRKMSVSRLNDESIGSLSSADHKSVAIYCVQNWGGIGKDLNKFCDGIDKQWTNAREVWTSRSWQGDRYDAWKKNYNEIFSPYSSPSTCNWDWSYSGVFIWLYNQDDNGVDFKIFQAPIQGGEIESQILAMIPPSRPVGLKLEEYYPPGVNYCHPKLIWEHNVEPNMTNSGELWYQVWRAKTNSMDEIPQTYVQIGSAHFPPEIPPYYIDNTIHKFDCEEWDGLHPGIPYPVRYYVIAVNDNIGQISVPSDFVSTEGALPLHGPEPGGDNNFNTKKYPPEYSLSQNYPNPFNPITNIRYYIIKQKLVTLKIYDILGREIKTLVNEVKNPGEYIVQFNGAELASGVYFYRLVAGDFTAVKRMVLIK